MARRQRTRSIQEMTFAEAERDTLRRAAQLGPKQRVRMIPELLAASLATQGIRELPRLRLVYSYPEPTSGALRRHRRLRSRVSRQPTRDR